MRGTRGRDGFSSKEFQRILCGAADPPFAPTDRERKIRWGWLALSSDEESPPLNSGNDGQGKQKQEQRPPSLPKVRSAFNHHDHHKQQLVLLLSLVVRPSRSGFSLLFVDPTPSTSTALATAAVSQIISAPLRSGRCRCQPRRPAGRPTDRLRDTHKHTGTHLGGWKEGTLLSYCKHRPLNKALPTYVRLGQGNGGGGLGPLSRSRVSQVHFSSSSLLCKLS